MAMAKQNRSFLRSVSGATAIEYALGTPFIEDQPSLQSPAGIIMTVVMAIIAVGLCGAVIFVAF